MATAAKWRLHHLHKAWYSPFVVNLSPPAAIRLLLALIPKRAPHILAKCSIPVAPQPRRLDKGTASPCAKLTHLAGRSLSPRSSVGEAAPLNGPITLVEYNPEWPIHFEREAQRIRRALGDRALRIEHTGATSVPGLIAKPIIDILLVVANSGDEPSYVPALEAAGYVLRIREPEK